MSKQEENKEKSAELFKTPESTISIETFIKKIEEDVDNTNNKELISAKQEEKKQVIYEYILGISKKAELLSGELKSLGETINKPDLPKKIRNENGSFTDTSEYSSKRADLLSEATKLYGAFVTLYDKAYLHGTKQNWKNVSEKFKAIETLIKNIKSHLSK